MILPGDEGHVAPAAVSMSNKYIRGPRCMDQLAVGIDRSAQVRILDLAAGDEIDRPPQKRL